MTPEKIIANIENYIATLTPTEQTMYKECLEVAESSYKLAKEIPFIVDKYPKDSILKYNPVLELVEITQELKRDIKEKMQKSTKGKSFVQRSKKLAKIIDENLKDCLKKAWVEEIDGIQIQCSCYNGYYGFLLKEYLDVPMFTSEEKQNAGEYYLKKCVPPYKQDYKSVEFDIADIKTKLSLHKVKKDKELECKVEIDGAIFNAQYFVNVVEILGENVIMYKHPDRNLEVVVFENDNGIGILVPMRR
jgi:hypothetical protein